MNSSQPHPDLEGFDALVGEWTTEATHPFFPSLVVQGESAFEWLEGGHFLIQRSRNEHPDFPDSLAVIGIYEGELLYHYYDSRGVHRVYEASLRDGVWRLSRDAPGFDQRMTATLEDDGRTIAWVGQMRRDDSAWEDDLAMTFRRK